MSVAREAAERLAIEWVADTLDGDVPAAYLAYVEEEFFDAIAEAEGSVEPQSLEDWLEDARLSAAERSWECRSDR